MLDRDVALATLPEKRQGKEMLDECLLKAEIFCGKVFGSAERVPEIVQNRLKTLKEGEAVVVHKKGDQEFKEGGLAVAYYSAEDGKIHVRDGNVNEPILLHEIMHYLSSSDEKGSGIKRYDTSRTLGERERETILNEAVTEMCARMATLDIDPNNLDSVIRLGQSMRGDQQKKGLNELPLSYKTCCDNFLKAIGVDKSFFLSFMKSAELLGKERCSPFVALCRGYMMQEPEDTRRYFVDVLGRDSTERFFDMIPKLPVAEKSAAQRTILLICDELDKNKKINKKTKKAIKMFAEFAHGKQNGDVDIQFEFPEKTQGEIIVLRAVKLAGIEIVPRVIVSLDFSILKHGEGVMNLAQRREYLFKKAVELAAVLEGSRLKPEQVRETDEYKQFYESLSKHEQRQLLA